MPKVVDHANRREEVAAAVLTVIGRVGLEGATLREIAREAGCTTGALSHYFRDKDDLIMFAFRLSNQRFGERLGQRLEGLSGLAAVRTALLEVLPVGAQRVISAIWLSFDARAVTEPELAVSHRARYRGWLELLLPLLEQAAAEGHTLQLRSQVIQKVRSLEVKPEMPLSEDVLAAAEEEPLAPRPG